MHVEQFASGSAKVCRIAMLKEHFIHGQEWVRGIRAKCMEMRLAQVGNMVGMNELGRRVCLLAV